MGEYDLYNPPMIQNLGYAAASNWQQYLLFKPLYTKQQLLTSYVDKFKQWAAESNLNLLNTNKGKGLSVGMKGPETSTTGVAGGNSETAKQSFTDKFKNSGWGKAAGMAGGALSLAYDAIPTMDEVHNSNDQLAADLRGTASKTLLSSGNPYAMAAGAGIMAIDKTGGFTDASKGLGGANDAANMFASLTFGGAGWFTGKTDKYTVSDTLASSSSYTGAADKGVTAMQNANAKILFGRDKAKRMIKEAKRRDNMVLDIVGDAKDRNAAAAWEGNGLRNWMELNGGMERMHLAKSGMKLPTKLEISKVREILSRKSGGKIEQSFFEIEAEDIELEIQEFKEGGQLNVIPEGALHARKHNMEDAEGLTKKGIPVIDKDGEQQAEIERDEIIFRKEVTQKLEELMRDGSDDAAIEAGKLLVEEIFNNTDDRTGLIASIIGEEPLSEEEELLSKMQNGGTAKPSYKDWEKTVKDTRKNSNYDLEMAYGGLPFDMLESWRLATDDELISGQKHLPSVMMLDNGDYIFLKKGKEEENEELKGELEAYRNGSARDRGIPLKNTHDLVFEGDRYYYRKRKNMQ